MIRLAPYAVSYFTDQLMTTYFSGGSTINGISSGDRWARVLGWADWLAVRAPSPSRWLLLWAYEFGNTNSWKKRKNLAPPKTYRETRISPATATTSRRRATKHVPRVSPYSPASIDPGFVEIGHVQLSQSVKRRMLHTDTQIDRLTK